MINVVILAGRAGTEPELRATSGGVPVCRFRLAVNESWKDRAGVRQERVDWFSIVIWGKFAELVGGFLRKGDLVLVKGKLTSRTWTDRDEKKHVEFEIVADAVDRIGGSGKTETAGGEDPAGAQQPQEEAPTPPAHPAAAAQRPRTPARAARRQEPAVEATPDSSPTPTISDDDVPF